MLLLWASVEVQVEAEVLCVSDAVTLKDSCCCLPVVHLNLNFVCLWLLMNPQ